MATTQIPLTGSTVITTNSAPAAGRFNRYNATSGSLVVTLPALSGLNVGARMSVQKFSGDISVNTITFNCSGTDKFDDGATTAFTLETTGQQREIQVVTISGVKRWEFVGPIGGPTTGGGGGGGGGSGFADVQTIAALRALTTTTSNAVAVMGYYTAGDGGGGTFRWDGSDTTSTDNGGTIITPSGSLSASGRWKRLYDGEVNARWFGVNPTRADNTAALQAAVDWASTYSTVGGTVFIPAGYYQFKFDQGTSGLSTITIDENYVTIAGEPQGTTLAVTNHSRPNQLAYFFTFTKGPSDSGRGGGVRDIQFYGQSMLKWCIYLNTWHGAEFVNIRAQDVHSGILDAECANTLGWFGEHILVKHLDHLQGVGGVTQYGVRFRAGSNSASTTWTDCYIEDCMFIGIWDTGVKLDSVARFTVRNTAVSWNFSSSDSIDGTAKAGVLHAVDLSNTIENAGTGTVGYHLVDGVYHESGSGSENTTNYSAVKVRTTTTATGTNRYNHISNVAQTYTGSAMLDVADDNGWGNVIGTTFTNSRSIFAPVIKIGPSVNATELWLPRGKTSGVTDLGQNTLINGGGTQAVTSSSTPSINTDSTTQFNVLSLATAVTSMTTNLSGTPVDGQQLDIRFRDNGTARAITWGASFTGILLSTTVANKTHLQRLKYDATAGKWAGYMADTAGY